MAVENSEAKYFTTFLWQWKEQDVHRCTQKPLDTCLLSLCVHLIAFFFLLDIFYRPVSFLILVWFHLPDYFTSVSIFIQMFSELPRNFRTFVKFLRLKNVYKMADKTKSHALLHYL